MALKLLSTIKKSNNINFILKLVDEDNKNKIDKNDLYYISKNSKDSKKPFAVLQFYSPIIQEDGSISCIHGVTDEDLLEIVRDRLSNINIKTKELDQALLNVENALLWLNKSCNDAMDQYKDIIKPQEEETNSKGE